MKYHSDDVGEHTIRYVYTSPSGCRDSAEIEIDIRPDPVIFLDITNEYGVDSVTYCEIDESPLRIRSRVVDRDGNNLRGTGEWTGPGIFNSENLAVDFRPSSAGNWRS